MKFFGQSGLLVLSLVLLGFASYGQQIYFEDFNTEANGATTGTAIGGTWTTLPSPSGGATSFSKRDVGPPYGGIIYIDQTGNGVNGEGVWQSNILNIAALGEVAIEVEMGGIGAQNTDYVRAYYRINSGPEILFGQVLGDDELTVFPASSAVVSGNTLQIVIRGRENTAGGLMGFHDVRVTDIDVLYSRTSTAWNALGTWSTVSFVGGSCGCLPDDESRVIIGGGRSVTFTADGEAAGLEIQSTGTLTWTANNADLTVRRGGSLLVQNGGTLTRAATTGSTLQFDNYPYSITNAGTLNIGSIIFNGGNGSTITNSGTLTMTGIDLNNNNITLNNSGTVDLNGNFTDVDAGSTFNNLSGGTWNFSGTTITGVRLFANNSTNTFTYDGAAQSIITPQDAYWHLNLAGSGAKAAQGDFAVRGNWTRSAGVTFTPGAFRVSFTGNAAQTVTANGGETFGRLTFNNTFATSPQITLNNPVTVTVNLTMTDGNVNLNGNAFTISASGAGALTHNQNPTAGWMYGAVITRAIPQAAIAVGNVAGYFPIGGSANSRPFLISKDGPANSNGNLTVQYTDANSATNITFMDGASTIQRRHDSFWTLTKTGMTAGVYQVTAGGTGFTIGNVNQTRLTRINNATAIGTAAASTQTPADVRAHRTGLTAAQLLNNFYLASTNSVASPLPVDLEWFQARIAGDEVITTWKTAQEKNNHFFTVEKTTDLETFHEVGTVDGQGNSSEENSYSFVDDSPFMGKSYYRLRQTDYDGAFTLSNLVMIDYSGPTFPFLKAFPNPSDGKKITLEVKGATGTQVVPVSIYNQQGQKVMDILMEEDGPGIFKKEVNFTDNLPAGLYILKAGRTLQLTSKLVVN